MFRRKQTFLITLWVENDERDGARETDWRASVEHLGTRRRLYFREMGDLVGFLSGWLVRNSTR